MLAGAVLCAMVHVPTTAAQSLIERYKQTRQMQLLDQLYPTSPLQPPQSRPYQHIATALDSLFEEAGAPVHEAPQFAVKRMRTAHRFEKGWLQETFSDTEWSFFGPQPQRTLLDTTRTVDLRARMQAHFGAPTYVLADDLQPNREDFDQFAYWFVVNDSIPVVVSDADGPRNRGVIVATERRWRSALPEVREAVLQPIRETPDRAPYVDYFYDRVDRRWYRAGYDGTQFFLEPVSRRALTPGRRPSPRTP